MRPASDTIKLIAQAKLDILYKEIDIIEESIRKIDDMSHSLKNWTIVTWGGSVALLLQHDKLYAYVAGTAIIPILFLFIDAHWRRIQRSFIYRFTKISDFINSDNFHLFINRGVCTTFPLLDPRGWKTKKMEPINKYESFVSIRKILNFRSVAWLYLVLAFISILLGIMQWAFLNNYWQLI